MDLSEFIWFYLNFLNLFEFIYIYLNLSQFSGVFEWKERACKKNAGTIPYWVLQKEPKFENDPLSSNNNMWQSNISSPYIVTLWHLIASWGMPLIGFFLLTLITSSTIFDSAVSFPFLLLVPCSSPYLFSLFSLRDARAGTMPLNLGSVTLNNTVGALFCGVMVAMLWVASPSLFPELDYQGSVIM